MKRDNGRIVLSPKERFWELENFKYYDPQRTAGKYNFPTNEPTQHWPKGLVGFHTLNDDPEQCANGVHFYIHDYKFECLWNKPERYFERFSKYDCIIAPDFSTYTDMSLAHVIWNTYRNRLLVQMMQDYGITVIPNIMWGAEETFEFCFDGLPKHSVLAVESVGTTRDSGDRWLWAQAMRRAIEQLEPTGLVLYGTKPEFDFQGVPVRTFGNTNDALFKAKSTKRPTPKKRRKRG